MTVTRIAVIGAGMAGLSAALAAREAGAAVTVLEKSAVAGGNARISAGMMLGSRDAAGLGRYIPDGDPRLLAAFCADYDGALAWLEGHGLPLEAPIEFGDFRTVRPIGLGQPGAREAAMEKLADRARSLGVRIELEAAVTQVARRGSGFTLVLADGRSLGADAVVIAAGGFAANAAMRREYMGPDADALFARTRPGANGDGLRLALSLGAATSANMLAFYGHSLPDCDLPRSEWQPLTPYFARIGILVNRDGRRFTDESNSLLEETNPQVAFHQPGGRYWLVFDVRIRLGEGIDTGTSGRLPLFDWLARARAHDVSLLEAPTLAALCNLLAGAGVDHVALAAELHAYNHACRSGEQLPVPRGDLRIAIESPPFYALRCKAAITATCGGIAIDASMRVLDARGQPIPGLFAAGVDAGGVYGRTYGGFLSWALVSGRRAGGTAIAPAIVI